MCCRAIFWRNSSGKFSPRTEDLFYDCSEGGIKSLEGCNPEINIITAGMHNEKLGNSRDLELEIIGSSLEEEVTIDGYFYLHDTSSIRNRARKKRPFPYCEENVERPAKFSKLNDSVVVSDTSASATQKDDALHSCKHCRKEIPHSEEQSGSLGLTSVEKFGFVL